MKLLIADHPSKLVTAQFSQKCKIFLVEIAPFLRLCCPLYKLLELWVFFYPICLIYIIKIPWDKNKHKNLAWELLEFAHISIASDKFSSFGRRASMPNFVGQSICLCIEEIWSHQQVGFKPRSLNTSWGACWVDTIITRWRFYLPVFVSVCTGNVNIFNNEVSWEYIRKWCTIMLQTIKECTLNIIGVVKKFQIYFGTKGL